MSISHRVALDDAMEDPDGIVAIYFTSGTSGEPTGALHTHNTMYAQRVGWVGAEQMGPQDTVFSPHSLMHTLAGYFDLLLPLLTRRVCGVVGRLDG